MNKLSCYFIASLFMFLAGCSTVTIQENRPDFSEFERIISKPMPWVKDEILVPNYRAMYLEQAKRFEVFLEKYSDSQLKPEALFRLATIFLDVEGSDIHMFRRELFFCQGKALWRQNNQDFYLCEQKFNLHAASSGKTDLAYWRLGRQILKGLVEQYPRTKRYFRAANGEFSFIEIEEIGAIALYILAKIAIPQDKKAYYETILEYNIRPELRREIQNRLIQ